MDGRRGSGDGSSLSTPIGFPSRYDCSSVGAPSEVRCGLACSQTPSVVGMIVVSRDRQKLLADVLERARHDEVNYEGVGQSRSNGQPSGYHHDRLVSPVGHGETDWARPRRPSVGGKRIVGRGLRLRLRPARSKRAARWWLAGTWGPSC